jgi:hypothetical protein
MPFWPPCWRKFSTCNCSINHWGSSEFRSYCGAGMSAYLRAEVDKGRANRDEPHRDCGE